MKSSPDRPFEVPLRLRPMSAADIEQVVDIESQSSPEPWERDLFTGCLRPDYLCKVVESEGRIVAYAVANHAAAEGHLLNLAVHPDVRAKGLGSRLLEVILNLLSRRFVETVYLEVRQSNTAAIQLYQRFGFTTIGIRHGYYALGSGREDALTMRLKNLDQAGVVGREK